MVSRRDFKYLMISIIPALLLTYAITYYPVFYAGYLSLIQYSLKMPEGNFRFIGADNYLRGWANPEFVVSARATVIFSVATMFVILGISLGFALLLSREFRAQKLLQVLVLLPWAIPQVSSALAWKWVFDNNFGVMNAILRSLNIIQTNQAWTGTELSAMLVILVSFVWVELPLPTLIFLAALQTIPKDMYEAAEIDGASAFSRFRYVTFKWLKPVLFIALIYESIMDVRAFDPVFVITQGAPGGTTQFISYFTYRTFFNFLEFGQASSYSIQVSIVMVALIFIYFRALRIGTLKLKV